LLIITHGHDIADRCARLIIDAIDRAPRSYNLDVACNDLTMMAVSPIPRLDASPKAVRVSLSRAKRWLPSHHSP
jgi:hypothetical protein